jgi:hypothetical protein
MTRAPLGLRRCAASGALAGLLLSWPAAAQPAVDAQFRDVFAHQYDRLKGVKADMVVEELRLRVELVASRGSQVGAASNDKRLRGFESLLQQNLQGAVCKDAAATASRPSPAVIDSVVQAAKSQRLRTENNDVAELSAIAQKLVDGRAAGSLCKAASLDEIR